MSDHGSLPWAQADFAALRREVRDVAPGLAADVGHQAAVRRHRDFGDRALVVKRLAPLPVEAIVRGYIIGSGWKDYQRSGAVCGIALPIGLRQAEQLPEPLFTPSTTTPVGRCVMRIAESVLLTC